MFMMGVRNKRTHNGVAVRHVLGGHHAGQLDARHRPSCDGQHDQSIAVHRWRQRGDVAMRSHCALRRAWRTPSANELTSKEGICRAACPLLCRLRTEQTALRQDTGASAADGIARIGPSVGYTHPLLPYRY